MTLGFLFGSKNFCKLLSVSWEVFVLHGYDWIHWVAKSCTKTAYEWLCRDSQPSLKTLRSAVIKSPKFSARGTAPPVRLMHGAPVILVLWQISQFRSLGKWEKNSVFTQIHTFRGRRPKRWFMRRTGGWVSVFSRTLSSTKFSLNSCSHSGMSECNRSHRSCGFLVGLVNSSSCLVPEEHRSLRACFSTCLLDTVTR